jgi:hypothetical protein
MRGGNLRFLGVGKIEDLDFVCFSKVRRYRFANRILTIEELSHVLRHSKFILNVARRRRRPCRLNFFPYI